MKAQIGEIVAYEDRANPRATYEVIDKYGSEWLLEGVDGDIVAGSRSVSDLRQSGWTHVARSLRAYKAETGYMPVVEIVAPTIDVAPSGHAPIVIPNPGAPTIADAPETREPRGDLYEQISQTWIESQLRAIAERAEYTGRQKALATSVRSMRQQQSFAENAEVSQRLLDRMIAQTAEKLARR